MEKINYILFAICFFGSFLGVYLITPLIVLIATRKKLVDIPNERSSHNKSVPRLGGVAFFFSIGIGMYLLQQLDLLSISVTLFTCFIILLLIGLKDDISSVKPRTKLIAHFICAGMIFLQPGFQLDGLNEIIHRLGWIEHPNVSFLVFLIIPVFINAYNLIDGIDGLATVMGIIIFSILGLVFYLLQDYFFLGICFLGVGSLLAFLRFNLTDNHFKLFMGDTGSMLIGFVISIMIIRICSLDTHLVESFLMNVYYVPVFILSVIFVPFYDMCRVMIVRLLRRQHVFVADKSHMHHILINYFHWSHIKTTLILGVLNSIVVALLYLCNKTIGLGASILFFTAIIISFSYILFRLETKTKSNKKAKFVKVPFYKNISL